MSEQQTRTNPASALAIESRSIERVPASERTGTVRNQFSMWFGCNMLIGAILTGAGSQLFGMPLAWTLVAIVLGQAVGGVLLGLHAGQGPTLGIPQMIQSRAQFGYIGAVVPLLAVVVLYVGYGAYGATVGAAGLNDLTGLNEDVGTVLWVLLMAGAAIFGHHMLHAIAKVAMVVGGIVFLILTIGFFTRNSVSFDGGSLSLSAFLAVMGLSAIWQLTYGPFVADYSRYLPEGTSVRTAFWSSYAGSVIASTWLFVLGACAATVAGEVFFGNGALEYVAGMAGFGTNFFIVMILVAFLPNCAMCSYGAFMSLSTILTTATPNLRITRAVRVVLILVATAIMLFVALAGSGDIVTFVLNLIQLLGFILIPWSAINIVDFYFVRREQYDIPAIFDRNGIYRGFDWRALTAYGVTIGLEALFVTTEWFTGPLYDNLGEADFSWIVGILVAGPLYYAIMHKWPVRNGVSALNEKHPQQTAPPAAADVTATGANA